MKWAKFIGICMLFICTGLQAQQLRFVNVTNDLKLPSPVCYNITRDQQGYIWIGTDAGLCRYDGNSLKIFDVKNGLPEVAIYDAAEAPNNDLWFLSSKSRIFHVVDESIREFPFSNKITKLVNSDFASPFKIQFAYKRWAFLNTKPVTYSIDLFTGDIHHMAEPDTVAYVFKMIDHAIVPIKTWQKTDGNVIKLLIDYENGEKLNIKIPRNPLASVHWRIEMANSKKYDLIGFDNHIIRIGHNYQYSIHTFPTRVLAVFVDSRDGLWVGTYKNGVYYYPNIDDLSAPIHSIESESVSGITEDIEDGIWCSTLEKGIFYCYNRSITDYSNIPGLDKYVDILKNVNGKIYAASDGLRLLEIGDEVVTHELNTEIITNIVDIEWMDKRWILSAMPAMLSFDQDFKKYNVIRQSDNNLSTNGYQLAFDDKKNLYIAGYSSLLRYDGGDKVSFLFTEIFKIPAKKIAHKSGDIFYLGSDRGLYEVNKKTCELKKVRGNGQITQLKRDTYGIWVTTRGEGFYLINDNGFTDVSKLMGIPSDFFYDITEDKYGNVWVGSNIGLLKIYNAEGEYKYKLYNMLDGLSSNNIYKVSANEEQIFMGTTEGVTSFPLTAKMNNHEHPNIFLKEIWVNEILSNSKNRTLELPYNKNSLRLVFDIISYRNFNHKTLFYILKTDEIKSQKIAGNEIILDNLKPNDYKLEVFGVNDDGVYSKEPIVFYISIQKPFWETAWFIVLSILFFCVMLYLSVKSAIDRVKKREAAKTQINKMMAEYQLTALQAQMNPHFIFNAINSIQSYILQKNEEEAYDYLAKFSKLIRMVLNNSEEKILTLQQELETLDLYIQLEQLRFENKFEYNLNISEDVNPHETYVPAMLIQPYAENAIWHGLMNLNSERNAVLSLQISIEKQELKIVVEDNGIGREAVQVTSQNRTHKSMGMKLVEKRLDMLNKIQEFENARVQIKDRVDADGKIAGTRVEIFIPIK